LKSSFPGVSLRLPEVQKTVGDKEPVLDLQFVKTSELLQLSAESKAIENADGLGRIVAPNLIEIAPVIDM